MFQFPETGSQYIPKINAKNFDDIALHLFRFQYGNNEVYRSYVDALHINPSSIKLIEQIPFLPISFFKTHKVISSKQNPLLFFESSGTSGEVNSKHYVFRKELYRTSILNGFQSFYGDPSQYAILALLPSYLERKNASLVHMAKVLMEKSAHAENGFYLNEWQQLHDVIQRLEAANQPILLLGVTFALLDFSEAFPMQLKHTTVMETGGMKGRREEWTRVKVHDFLKHKWQLPHIHSEYGMTELLSQAYSKRDGIFHTASTMKVLVRDLNDPLEIKTSGSGCINIIDLANVDSCAFIATEDIGTLHEDGSFEVLGRMDHTTLRGCSLMTA